MTLLKKPKNLKLVGQIPTISELDDLCRGVVRLRDKMKCQRCSRKPPYKIEWAHFYSRSNKAIRHDLSNSCLLCFNCHYNFAHKDPRGFSEWQQKRLGDKEFDALKLRAGNKAGDRRLVEIYLRQELKKYEK